MIVKYTNATTDPPEIMKRKCNNKKWIKILIAVLVTLMLLAFLQIFLVVPLIFMYSFALQEALMFTRFGLTTNQKDFEVNLPGVRNFYVNVRDIETQNTLTLGVWHMLPWVVTNETIDKEIDYLDLLEHTRYKVVILFHGTGETRLDSYKMSIVLRYFFHVFLFDYRGYGDSSSGKMSEEAVVGDCLQLYKWVMSKTKADIYIWGHSLGASLALHTAKLLSKEGISPKGIILEAAFTSMYEEIPYHPYGKIFAWLPYFDSTIRKPLLENGFRFDNVEYIKETTAAVLMFHAEDDSIIPLALGKKLYDTAVSPNRTAIFVQVPKIYGCDHFWLYIFPNLPYYIEKFLYGSKANWIRHLLRKGNSDSSSDENLRYKDSNEQNKRTTYLSPNQR